MSSFYESLVNDVYAPDDLSTEKKKSVSKASAEKKAALSPQWAAEQLNDALLNDFDGYGGSRLGTNEKGISLDALETSDFRYTDPKTKQPRNTDAANDSFANQQKLVGERLDIAPEDVTTEDIISLGKQDRNTASDILFEGQENFFTDGTTEGPVRPNQSESGMPIVEVFDTGKTTGASSGNRPVKDFRNPITGKTLSQSLNTPELNVNYENKYNPQGRFNFENTSEGKERILENTDRTGGEVAGDIATGLGKAVVNTGATAYGVADVTARTLMNPINMLASQIDKVIPDSLKSGYTLGQSETPPEFARTNQILDEEFMSEQTKLSQRKMSQQMKEHNEGSEARKAKWIKDKTFSPIGAEIADLVYSIGAGAKAGLNNPLALQDVLVTSAPQLVYGGIFGRAAVSKAIANKTAGMSTKEASEFITSKAGKELVNKTASRTGIATEAVQESMINAVHKQQEILNMSETDLSANSDYYKSLVSSGLSHEAARLEVANSAFNTTAAITAVISAGASKGLGTGERVGKAFVREGGEATTGKSLKNLMNAGLSKTISSTTNAAREAGQEIVQEGGAEFAGNVAEKLFVDKDKSLTEGVGTSAGLGGIAGAGTSVGLSGLSTAAKAVIKTPKVIKKSAEKAAEVLTGKDTPKSETEQPAYTKVSDANTEDPVKATDAILNSNQLTDVEKAEGVIAKQTEIMEKIGEAPDKETEQALIKEYQRLKGESDALIQKATEELMNDGFATEGKPTTAETTTVVSSLLNTPPNQDNAARQQEITRAKNLFKGTEQEQVFNAIADYLSGYGTQLKDYEAANIGKNNTREFQSTVLQRVMGNNVTQNSKGFKEKGVLKVVNDLVLAASRGDVKNVQADIATLEKKRQNQVNTVNRLEGDKAIYDAVYNEDSTAYTATLNNMPTDTKAQISAKSRYENQYKVELDKASKSTTDSKPKSVGRYFPNAYSKFKKTLEHTVKSIEATQAAVNPMLVSLLDSQQGKVPPKTETTTQQEDTVADDVVTEESVQQQDDVVTQATKQKPKKTPREKGQKQDLDTADKAKRLRTHSDEFVSEVGKATTIQDLIDTIFKSDDADIPQAQKGLLVKLTGFINTQGKVNQGFTEERLAEAAIEHKTTPEEFQQNVAGEYDPRNNSLTLNTTGKNETIGLGETITHELTHAATQQLVREALNKSPKDRTEAEKNALAAFNKVGNRFIAAHKDSENITLKHYADVLQRAKNKSKLDKDNGAYYLSEVISHGLTNDAVMEALDNMYVGTKKRSLGRDFVDAIIQLLGLNKEEATELTRLLEGVDDLLTTPKSPSKSKTTTSATTETASKETSEATPSDTTTPEKESEKVVTESLTEEETVAKEILEHNKKTVKEETTEALKSNLDNLNKSYEFTKNNNTPSVNKYLEGSIKIIADELSNREDTTETEATVAPEVDNIAVVEESVQEDFESTKEETYEPEEKDTRKEKVDKVETLLEDTNINEKIDTQDTAALQLNMVLAFEEKFGTDSTATQEMIDNIDSMSPDEHINYMLDTSETLGKPFSHIEMLEMVIYNKSKPNTVTKLDKVLTSTGEQAVDPVTVEKSFDVLPQAEDILIPSKNKHNSLFTSKPNIMTRNTDGLSQPVKNVIAGFTSIFNVVKSGINKTQRFANYKNNSMGDIDSDPSLLLADRNNNLPENVLDAMTIVAANWLANRAKETLFNNRQAINAVLGRKANAHIADAGVSEQLKYKGSVASHLAQELGRQILTQLGVKVSANTPLYFTERLQQALGQRVINTLLSQGILKGQTMSRTRLNVLTVAAEGDPRIFPSIDPSRVLFVKLVEGTRKNKDTGKPERIAGKATVDGTVLDFQLLNDFVQNPEIKQGIDSLFGLNAVEKGVSDTPVTDIQKKAKNSTTEIPIKYGNNVKNAGSVEWTMVEGAESIVGGVSDEFFLDITEAPSKEDVSTSNRDLQEGQESRNEDLKTQIGHIRNHLESNKDNIYKPFFYVYSIWKNFRMGVDSNTINAQASKLHRFLTRAKEWKSTFTINPVFNAPSTGKHNAVFDEQRAYRDNLFLGIAQGLGMGIDKAPIATTKDRMIRNLYDYTNIKPTADRFKDKDIKRAVELIHELQKEGSLGRKKEIELATIVKKFEEKTHSYIALVTLANYEKALVNKQEEFTHYLPVEIDGVTNGTASTLLQYSPWNANYKSKLNAVGIYFEGDTATNFLEWRGTEGNKDNYESLARESDKVRNRIIKEVQTTLTDYVKNAPMENKVNYLRKYFPRMTKKNAAIKMESLSGNEVAQESLASIITEKLLAAKELMGDFDRTSAKDPLMVFQYMAGVPSIARKYTSGVYEGLQKELTKNILSIQNKTTELLEATKANDAAEQARISAEINALGLKVHNKNTALRTLGKDANGNIPTHHNTTVTVVNDSVIEELNPIQQAVGFISAFNNIKATEVLSEIAYRENVKDSKYMSSNVHTQVNSFIQNFSADIFDASFQKEYGELRDIRADVNLSANVANLMFMGILRSKINAATINGKITQLQMNQLLQDMRDNGEMFTVKGPQTDDTGLNKGKKPKKGKELPTNRTEIHIFSKEKNLISAEDGGRVTSRMNQSTPIPITHYDQDENNLTMGGALAPVDGTQEQTGVNISVKQYADNLSVKSLPGLVIPMDAYTNNKMMGLFSVLGIHDALLMASNTMHDMAGTYNDTYTGAFNWDMIDSVYNSVNRIHNRFTKHSTLMTSTQQKEVKDSIINILPENMQEELGDASLEEIINAVISKLDTRNVANKESRVSRDSSMTVVDQYPSGKGEKTFSNKLPAKDTFIEATPLQNIPFIMPKRDFTGEQVREESKKALDAMGFVFSDKPAAPDLSLLSRVASKILTDKTHSDRFVNEASASLAHVMFYDINQSKKDVISIDDLQAAIFEWLHTGKTPVQKQIPKSFMERMLFRLREFLRFFDSTIAGKNAHVTDVDRAVTKALNNLLGGNYYSFNKKEGYEALDFQGEFDNNPESLKNVLSLVNSDIPVVLTGSVAYADQVPVYRAKGKPMHDVDFLLDNKDIERAKEHIAKFNGSEPQVLYDVGRGNKRFVGVAVVKEGLKVVNYQTGWINKNVYRKYEVEDADGNNVGSYDYLAESHETFKGEAGITLDLISSKEIESLPQSYMQDGVEHTIPVASYIHGFSKKLELLRQKDINDFLAVIPPAQVDIGENTDFNDADYSNDEIPANPLLNQQQAQSDFELQGSTVRSANDPNQYNSNITKESIISSETFKGFFDSMVGVGNVKENAEHLVELNKVVNDIIIPGIKAGETFNLKQKKSTGTDTTGFSDAVNNNIYLNNAVPPSNTGMINGVTANMSSSEVFAHEMLHVLFKEGIDNNPYIRRMIAKQYQKAKKATVWQDLIPVDKQTGKQSTNPSDLAQAQEQYKYIFRTQDQSKYLHEFATFALTNEQFINHLSNIDATPAQHKFTGGGIFGAIKALAMNLVQWLSAMATGSRNKNIHQMMNHIMQGAAASNVKGLSRIESAKQTGYASIVKANEFIQENASKHVVDPYNARVAEYVKGALDGERRRITRIMAVPLLLPNYFTNPDFRAQLNKFNKETLGISRGAWYFNILKDVMGNTEWDEPFHELLTLKDQAVDTRKINKAAAVKKSIVDSYDPENPPTDEDWSAINDVLLKADLSSLYDVNNPNSLKEIVKLLKDSKHRDKEIASIVDRLKTNLEPNRHRMMLPQIESLGHYMATGKVGLDSQLFNPFIITILGNFGKPDAAIEADLERLGTLYAIQYTDKSVLDTALKVIDNEMARTLDKGALNGIQQTMGVHNIFKEESLKNNFDGNKALMVKGYTKENYDTQMSITYATAKEGQELETKGYVKVLDEVLPKSNKEAGLREPVYMYKKANGKLEPRVTGIANLISEQSKGVSLTKGVIYSKAGDIGKADFDAIANINQEFTTDLNNQRDGKVKLNFKKTYLAPSISNDMKLKGYRYLMSEGNKRTILGKEDLAPDVLGSMFGSSIDKQYAQDFNNTLIDLLINDYETVKSELHKDDFITLDNKNEYYRLLPTSAKLKIQEKIGKGNSLKVRKDLVELAFGFRKWSMSEALNNSKLNNKGILTPIAAAMKLSGQLWEYVVNKKKRNVVVLNPDVVIDNMVSNLFLLGVKGISPDTAIKDMKEALYGIIAYDKDTAKLEDLELKAKSNPNSVNIAEWLNDIEELKLKIKTNIVTPMIKAGLFQTIAEDIDPNNKEFSRIFKTKLGKEIKNKLSNKVTDRVAKTGKDIYDTSVMSSNTEIGKLADRTIQYGDFLARYALWKHRNNNSNMVKKDIKKEVLETFINYNIPTNVVMQYLNDTGLIMFSKFAFRIVRVIAKVIKEAPTQVAALEAAQQILGDVSDIMDTGIPNVNGPGDTIEDAFVFNLWELVTWPFK